MSDDHIVVGVDGSPESRSALAWAVELARDLDAELLVVHAAEVAPAAMFLTDHDPQGTEYAELRHRLEQTVREDWCGALVGTGIPFEIVVEEGGPALVLMSAAERVAARMIVVGPRGGGGFPGLSLGTVGLQLAQYAKHPVTIVRSN